MNDARTRTLIDAVRRARVEGTRLVVHGPRTGGGSRLPFVAGRGVRLAFDESDGLADIDGALPLGAAARRLERLGGIFPLARPLPPLTLAAACAALPYFVDAYIQQASLLTFAGDVVDTPHAPRAAAGPSLLATLCARPPLAVCLQARVRVQHAAGAVVTHEELGDVRSTARRLRDLLEDGRAFSVDAWNTSLVVLAGGGSGVLARGAFRHEGRGRQTRFARAVSLVPGDVDGIARALADGARVVAAPFMGRVAALTKGDDAWAVQEMSTAAAQLGAALATGGRR